MIPVLSYDRQYGTLGWRWSYCQINTSNLVLEGLWSLPEVCYGRCPHKGRQRETLPPGILREGGERDRGREGGEGGREDDKLTFIYTVGSCLHHKPQESA